MIRNKVSALPYLSAIFMIACLLSYSGITSADDLAEPHPSGAACKGSLSPLGRWCDNHNGTVTDMSTGVIWLKDASWGGQYPFVDRVKAKATAANRAAEVKNGNPAWLTDGSVKGDWVLPTLKQLKALATGTEGISTANMYYFTGVQETYYWSNTSPAPNMVNAWAVCLYDGKVFDCTNKTTNYQVWPVRGGQ
ncbi:MAG: DUF1566 domain-containing protein [Deltaproteobacteria bacterium]|nr:DUF1566 domain-containing protein [Deltaproteobacteria bacterium]